MWLIQAKTHIYFGFEALPKKLDFVFRYKFRIFVLQQRKSTYEKQSIFRAV